MTKNPNSSAADLLLSYFQDALHTMIIAETAKHHAKQAEDTIKTQLATTPAANALYTTPDDLSQEQLDQLAKQSLDAHLKQVQSAQLGTASLNRLW